MKKNNKAVQPADKLIVVTILALSCISILMLESTVYDNGFVMSRAVIVQAAAYIIGFILILGIQFMEYHMFFGIEKFLYAASIVMLLSVYIPGLGIEQYGSKAWIDLGVTTLQPSEFVKIPFVLIMASYFSEHNGELNNFIGVVKSLLIAAPIIVIVLKEDLGSALVFAAIWLFMLFFAGIDYKVLLKCIVLVLIAIPIAYRFLDDYQKERIEAFLHPDNLSLSGNYQVWQSKVAIGSGGIFGKGLFKGTQKDLDFIPVQQSDFIFSVVCEELGFVGGAAIILLYAFLLVRCFKIVRYAEDMYGALIVVGFTGMFLFQIFENIAMTMGFMPVTGITLPLLSGGGTSVIASLISIGIILNIGSHSDRYNF